MNTPIKKILTNLSTLKSQSSSKQPVALVLGGTFNPVHKQHIDTLEIAKRGIEKQYANIQAVAGYISPCSDSYVKRKLGDEAISADQRIEMIKLTLEESNWIEFDTWEAKDPSNFEKHLPTYVVTNNLLNYLNSNSEVMKYCDNVKVMCVVGSDSCSSYRGRFKKMFEQEIELIIVNREKNNPDWENDCKNFLDFDFNTDSQKFISFYDNEEDRKKWNNGTLA
ncbi:MAG: hypothetical protein I3273_00910 [Candidatus Moeniiplasma glomeromycotorum]|nr:hypothetical protein [Candidatus Moeniiplasma glomeromycotorum]MCE8167316.1 hypothetical protein [Candidatus Moeniiplasma glomeromycotorum]MCE8168670.1 hypothetical protein [Candidatus Moeniiplasma glomeromycotorum]